MKKFYISTSAGNREVNANEYSVSPKSGEFSAIVRGELSPAWSTAGKGKSAIPNYYLYFRDGATLYYFRSNPVEIAAARERFALRDSASFDEDSPETTDGEDADIENGDPRLAEVTDEPAPKRRRSRK